MADDEELTPEQLQQATTWIEAKWTTTQTCPWDGTNQWEIESRLGHLIAGRQVEYPLIVLTCSNCGYSVFLNAIKLGIVTKREPATAETTGTGEAS